MIHILLLIGTVIFVSAGDQSQRQEKILHILRLPNLYNLTEILLSKNDAESNSGTFDSKDFGVLISMATNVESIDVSGNQIADFDGVKDTRATLRKLNLSNNSFVGQFPLQECLVLFPHLEELIIDDNKVTQLYKNGECSYNCSLKKYSASGTDCSDVDLGQLSKMLQLETLNLSRSHTLQTFSGLSNISRKDNSPVLSVVLKESLITDNYVSQCQKQGFVNTERASNLFWFTYCVGMALGFGAEFGCAMVEPHYCGWYPIPTGNPPSLVYGLNIILTTWAFVATGAKLADLAGKAIAYRFLKNNGKQKVIEFITNNNGGDNNV